MKDKDKIRELQRENELLKEILDHVSTGVYATDKDGKIMIYNRTMEKIEGTNRNFILGYNDAEIYNSFSKESYLRNEVFSQGKIVRDRRVNYHTSYGNKVEMVTDAYPYYIDDQLEYFYCILQDFSSINRLQERVIALSTMLAKEKKSREVYPNGTTYTFADILGDSAVMRETVAKAKHISASASNVLIYGETGTGKELFAQSIHNNSSFKEGPFVAVNCASIPNNLLESQLFGTVKGAFSDAKDMPGLFEQAENGTLFLDEINSMDVSLQAKLLRVLQDKIVRRLGGQKPKRINCRIICATNKNPFDEDFKEYFREDLLYRLMTIIIMIPPLRERKEDIPLLTQHFINTLNAAYGTSIRYISNEFKDMLMSHEWPGNIRQLSNLIESCICYLEPTVITLELSQIPSYLQEAFIFKQEKSTIPLGNDITKMMNEYETTIINEALAVSGGNMAEAARKLGISRQNLRYRMNKLRIKVNKSLPHLEKDELS